MFLNISSASLDKLLVNVFGFVIYPTWNFVSRICFSTWVFMSLDFLSVITLFFGSRLNFLIVRKTFLST